MFTKEILADFAQRETPFYYYDLSRLDRILSAATSEAERYGYHIHYAVKANANPEILDKVKSFGMGTDCVTGQEVQASLEAGFEPQKIAFAGVGKSDKEIELALNAGIFSFNVESLEELKVIEELAAKLDKSARVALRINPDVNANTHKYITTGLEENKFGINFWELEDVLAFLKSAKHLELTGIHFHIGSQITDLSAFKHLCLRVNEIQNWFQEKKVELKHINLGGGLGIDYEHPDEKLVPDFVNYFRIFHEFLELKPKQEVHFELGRALVAAAGDLIARVLYVKKGVKTNFAILDAGMTELIRPALYQAYHKIENITSTASDQEKYDVVGPICESSDCFGKQVMLPETQRGDLIAIRCAGAYGEVMASNYNLRPKAPSVFK
tara:strand:+ start:3496 stop:4644 length:1149 start_codon:yes stop_codon:yes gene_type:complete